MTQFIILPLMLHFLPSPNAYVKHSMSYVAFEVLVAVDYAEYCFPGCDTRKAGRSSRMFF
jgi:hypothetical protein